MWRRERRALEAELVSDCEAFLTGRYAERLEAQDVVVPVWAWTNLLAHGSEAQLRAAASEAVPAAGDVAASWRSARAVLCAELLATSGSAAGCPLGELQGSVLAPLELRLASRAGVGQWHRRTWLEVVRAALRAHRPTRQS